VATMALVVLGFQPGANKFTIKRPEGTREYYVWVPKNYNPNINNTVIFSFHGLGDECTTFGRRTGFMDMSEKYGFLFVYPCGSNGALGVAWNAGTCCLRWSSTDDLQFVRLMIGQIRTDFRVNASRVFSTGFSNGGMLTEVMMCQDTQFAAYASVAGVVEMEPGNSGGLQACTDAYSKLGRKANLLMVHGNADPVVPWGGNSILGFPDQPSNFAHWAKRNGCTGDPVQTFKNGSFTNQVYKQCGQGTIIELMTYGGGGHVWPRTNSFQVQEYIWSWFQRFM